MVFLTELATNMSNAGVQMIIYVGNDDGISPHFGTEGQCIASFSNFSKTLTLPAQ